MEDVTGIERISVPIGYEMLMQAGPLFLWQYRILVIAKAANAVAYNVMVESEDVEMALGRPSLTPFLTEGLVPQAVVPNCLLMFSSSAYDFDACLSSTIGTPQSRFLLSQSRCLVCWEEFQIPRP
jgi:hypothetical protein